MVQPSKTLVIHLLSKFQEGPQVVYNVCTKDSLILARDSPALKSKC